MTKITDKMKLTLENEVKNILTKILKEEDFSQIIKKNTIKEEIPSEIPPMASPAPGEDGSGEQAPEALSPIEEAKQCLKDALAKFLEVTGKKLIVALAPEPEAEVGAEAPAGGETSTFEAPKIPGIGTMNEGKNDINESPWTVCLT